MQDQPDATAQLYAALAKAQGAFSPIKKDRDGQTGNHQHVEEKPQPSPTS